MPFDDLSSFFFPLRRAYTCAELINRINVELALKRCALVSLSIPLGCLIRVMNRDVCLALRGAVYVDDGARWRDHGGCAAPVSCGSVAGEGISTSWSRY
jgi:hypothetical protein